MTKNTPTSLHLCVPLPWSRHHFAGGLCSIFLSSLMFLLRFACLQLLPRPRVIFPFLTCNYRLKKYSRNLKVAYCLIWWEFLGLQAWGATSQVAWETALRSQGKESGDKKVRNEGGRQSEHQRWLLTKENQIAQVKEFSFLCMGRCKHLGSLKSSVSYVSRLSGASSCVFTFPVHSKPAGLIAVRSQVFFSFLNSRRAHQLTPEGCICQWLWHLCLPIWK